MMQGSAADAADAPRTRRRRLHAGAPRGGIHSARSAPSTWCKPGTVRPAYVCRARIIQGDPSGPSAAGLPTAPTRMSSHAPLILSGTNAPRGALSVRWTWCGPTHWARHGAVLRAPTVCAGPRGTWPWTAARGATRARRGPCPRRTAQRVSAAPMATLRTETTACSVRLAHISLVRRRSSASPACLGAGSYAPRVGFSTGARAHPPPGRVHAHAASVP